MSKKFIIIGAFLIVVGLFWPLLQKLHLGRLPGDILVKREGFHFYFPLTTCLLISGIVTLLYWFFKK
ncbi:MAG: DUF2905 domain-containing protein [Desulforhopalus sp.]